MRDFIVLMKKKKKNILLVLGAFFLFVPSYYDNIFSISDLGFHMSFEEVLVIGRQVESQERGIFSHAGLPGIVYDKEISLAENETEFEPHRNGIIFEGMKTQYNFYKDGENIPQDYMAYMSQTGASGIMYSVLGKILPFDNITNLNIYRFINAVLVSLVFIIFLGWCYRNFGLLPAIITFVLIFLSSLLVFFGVSLWWSIWSYFIPFLTILLLLEKRSKKTDSVSNRKIYFFLFVAVFIRTLFTGFEFFTTVLLAIFVPIVYYYFLERKKLSDFFIFSFKIGLVIILAVTIETLILLCQITVELGGIDSAMSYLSESYLRRTTFVYNEGLSSQQIAYFISKVYLGIDIFKWKFISKGFDFHYLYMFIIYIICGVYIYMKQKNKERKYNALLLTTGLSSLCSLSWLIVFKQHAYFHPHLDHIVWYVPFMLLGYLVVGVALDILLNKRGKSLRTRD